MKDSTARAVASAAVAFATAAITVAAPEYGSVAILGMLAGIYFIWG